MKKTLHNLMLMALCIVMVACEDPIDIELDEGRSQLVVDAFISNDMNPQTIRLTKSANFFLNAAAPIANNVNVNIEGPNGVIYNFVNDNQGNYTYDPTTMGAIDSVGFNYRLLISYNGEVYQSFSKLNPVPDIDSMTFAFEEAELGSEEGYYSQFYATDFRGRKDYYRIKAFRNGEPLYPENPEFINLSEDAAFGGEGADGFQFIFPIRAAITDEDNPFLPGEISSVELWSLNQDAYSFLQQMVTQANNDGLFSVPAANIRSNILDISGSAQDEVLGVFSVSSVSINSITITP